MSKELLCRWIILVVIVVLCANYISAGPFIGSVSGLFSNGNNLTIRGSGFGQKERPGPLIWDDFEAGVAGENLSSGGIWTIKSTGNYWPQFSDENLRNNSLMNAKCVLVNPEVQDPPNATGDAQFWRNDVGFADSGRAYLNFWVKYDQGVADPVDGDWQLKLWRLAVNVSSPSGEVTYPSISNFNWDYNGGLKTRELVPYGGQTYYHPSAKSFADVTRLDPDAVDNGSLFGEGWFNIALAFKASSLPGSSDASVRWYVSSTADAPESYTVKDVPLGVGDYYISQDNASVPLINAVKFGEAITNGGLSAVEFFDDIYVDNSFARVEIGDAPKYEDCTHREIQIPVSWSDDAVTFTANPGSFDEGDIAYVFVIDGSENISDGFPVVITSGNVSWPVIRSKTLAEIPDGLGVYTLRIKTDKTSMCRYDNQSGLPYYSMRYEFDQRGTTEFTTSVYGLENGEEYSFYIRCICTSCGWIADPYDFILKLRTLNATLPKISSVNASVRRSGAHLLVDGRRFGGNGSQWFFWDDFEGGVEGGLLKDYSSWEQNAVPGSRYSGAESYSGNLSAYNQIWEGSGTSFSTNHIVFNATSKVFASYRFKASVTGENHYGVLKLSRLTSNYDGNISYFIDFYHGPGDTMWGRSSSECINGTLQGSFDSGYNTTRLYNGAVVPSVWQRFDMYKLLSTPGEDDGMILFQDNNKVTWQECLQTRESGFNFSMYAFTLGLMLANPKEDGNFSLFIDDVYLSDSLARVEICNESDWKKVQAFGAHCELQVPSFWNRTQIIFNLNIGSFRSKDPLYLFVVDDHGNANEGFYLENQIPPVCASLADTDGDGQVSKDEFESSLERWVYGLISLRELMRSAEEWKDGC